MEMDLAEKQAECSSCMELAAHLMSIIPSDISPKVSYMPAMLLWVATTDSVAIPFHSGCRDATRGLCEDQALSRSSSSQS